MTDYNNAGTLGNGTLQIPLLHTLHKGVLAKSIVDPRDVQRHASSVVDPRDLPHNGAKWL